MAILPGLYSLRFLLSFSLLIFSATTSVEKAEAMLIRSILFIYLHMYHCFPQKYVMGLSKG